MPLPLTISCSSKSRLVLTFLVLPFWYLLTRVVPGIFQKSSKTVVCVCVLGRAYSCIMLFAILSVWHEELHQTAQKDSRSGSIWLTFIWAMTIKAVYVYLSFDSWLFYTCCYFVSFVKEHLRSNVLFIVFHSHHYIQLFAVI